MYLTMSIVLFLKQCSRHQSLQSHLSTPYAENMLKRILKAEEMFSNEKDVSVDIE